MQVAVVIARLVGLPMNRLHIVRPEHGAWSTLADDVRAGMASTPRTIPPKHFYDAVGSALFDRICELPEYYLTRAERGLLERVADEIVDRTGASELVELGSGMARKTGLLIGAMARRHPAPSYVPLDIAESALEASARTLLRAHKTLRVRAIVADFTRDLATIELPVDRSSHRLFAFLGSTIGNLDETEAPALVRSVAKRMTARDSFLLGVDLVKDRGVLERAYDDTQGVTAAFNKNVLAVLDRELDADFDVDAFDHEAPFVAERSRIEMHLRARSHQVVNIRALDLRVEFAKDERILTEISRKFTRESTSKTLSEGGMRLEQWFSTDDRAFALALARQA